MVVRIKYEFELESAEVHLHPDRYKDDYTGINADFRAVLYRISRSSNREAVDSVYIPVVDIVLDVKVGNRSPADGRD